MNNLLNELRIRELVAAADANETYAAFAVEVFKQKHTHRHVRFDDLREKVVNWLMPIQIIDGAITIRQFDIGQRLLKHFGHLISSIEVHHSDLYVPHSNPEDFYNHINLYCADSLKSLTLKTHDQHLFTGMRIPFANVKSLSISGLFDSFDSQSLSFSELFPAVQELSLSPDQIDDKNSIDRHFPKLSSLSINFNRAFEHNVLLEEDFEKLLLKNPQIQNLGVSSSTPKFMNTVSKILPNITNLTLHDYNLYNDTDCEYETMFKHVSNFTLVIWRGYLPHSIFFESLKQLNVDSFANRDWLFLVQRNPHLEKLNFANGLIYNNKFEQIISSNLNLVEISLQLDHNVTDENILRFLRNHKSAHRISLNTWGKQLPGYIELGEILQEEFGDAYNVSAGENKLVINRV